MAAEIRAFVATGAVADAAHLVHKQPYEENRLRKIMRDKGFVPVLDITPTLTTEFLHDKGTLKYEVSVYGTRVEGDAWLYEGWLAGRLIPATPASKSKQYLNLVESTL